MNYLLKRTAQQFATLALAEHNGKTLSKNTLKLITAAQKLKDEVNSISWIDSLACLRAHFPGTFRTYQPIRWNRHQQSNQGSHSTPVTIPLLRIAEEISLIIKNLITKGGYKNVIGLSTSIGKDVIPRAAGQHSSQPIGDIIDISVSNSLLQGPNTYVRPTYAGNALTKVTTTQ